MAAAARLGAVVFSGGLALCVLLGGEVAAVVVGFANLGAGISVALITAGLLLAPWTGVAGVALLHRGLRRRGGLDGPPVMGTAAAKIEQVREIQEGEEVLLQLDLTIAPDDRPAYRADAGVDVHLSQVGDYRTGRILVVDYELGRPWRVVVRKDSNAEWAARLATSRIDTAPAATRRTASAWPPGTSSQPPAQACWSRSGRCGSWPTVTAELPFAAESLRGRPAAPEPGRKRGSTARSASGSSW